MKRRELTFIIVALVLGAVLGGLLGEIIGMYLPESGAKTLLSKSVQIGFSPSQLDLYSVSLTVGFMFKLNFMSILVVLLVIVYFRWWYL
ncbi:MAG: DUF4321 domain-containing protein [Candidatus Zixiibacteriota bacterium]